MQFVAKQNSTHRQTQLFTHIRTTQPQTTQLVAKQSYWLDLAIEQQICKNRYLTETKKNVSVCGTIAAVRDHTETVIEVIFVVVAGFEIEKKCRV